jgi:hypothetical protein
MGELLDKLNALDGAPTRDEPINLLADQAARAFRSASQRLNDAIEAIQEPGMPLDALGRFARQAPLQALTISFLVGMLVARRR